MQCPDRMRAEPTAAPVAAVILNNFGVHGDLLRGYGAALAIDKITAFVLLFIFAALLGLPDVRELYSLVADYSFAMHVMSVFACCVLLLFAAPTPACRQGGWLRILVLVVIQLGFSALFISFDHRQGLLDQSEGMQRTGYGLVSFFRWSADAWVLILVVEQVCSMRLAAVAKRVVAAPTRSSASALPLSINQLPSSDALASCEHHSEIVRMAPIKAIVSDESSRALRPLPLWVHATATAAAGLAFTVPWLAETYPNDANLQLWVPYPKQAEVFAAAYTVLGLAFICGTCCLLYYAHQSPDAAPEDGARSHVADGGGGAQEGGALGGGEDGGPGQPRVEQELGLADEDDQARDQARRTSLESRDSAATHVTEATLEASIGRLPGYTLRIGLLGACAALRCVSQAAMCTFLAESADFSAAVAQLLMVIVFFEDGQGVITFVLFGFGLLPLAVARAQKLWRWLGCCAAPTVHDRLLSNPNYMDEGDMYVSHLFATHEILGSAEGGGPADSGIRASGVRATA